MNITRNYIMPVPKDPQETVDEIYGPKDSDYLVVPPKPTPLDVILDAIKSSRPIIQPTTGGNKFVLNGNINTSSTHPTLSRAEEIKRVASQTQRPISPVQIPTTYTAVPSKPNQGTKRPVPSDKYLDPTIDKKRKVSTDKPTSPKVIYPSPTSPEIEAYEDRPLTADISDGLKDALAKYKADQASGVTWDSDEEEDTRKTKRPNTVEGKRKKIKTEDVNPNKTKRPAEEDTPNKKPKVINPRVKVKKL